MNFEDKLKIIDTYISCYNNFDVDGMLRLLHEDVEFKNISNQETSVSTKGIKDLEALANQSKAIFKTRKQTVKRKEDLIEKVVIHITFEGVLAIDLPNGLKEGETIKLDGISEFRFIENKISQIIDIS